jgi:hypothetical protein
MGKIVPPKEVLRIAAVTAGSLELFDWCCERLADRWGPIELRSPLFSFEQTAYYAEEMGAPLQKQLLAFARLADPAGLATWKLESNALEERCAGEYHGSVARPVNIDPGYLTEAKLVLATTKDRDHRIYLHSGIYAEITLYYQERRWQASRWTYADYQQAEYHDFFSRSRELLRRSLSAPRG